MMGEMRNKSIGRHDPDAIYARLGLASPFPRGITHADIDCLTEINHHYLVSEYKGRGESMPKGQFYTLQSFWENGHHCLVVWFDQNDVVGIHVWGDATKRVSPSAGDFKDPPMRDATARDLHRIEAAWAAWADANPMAPRR